MLYPNDEPEAGKRLRLLQQYFFVSCSLQHVLHIMDDLADAVRHGLPERFALQLNDTHPSIGVAELMRLLVDEHELDWDEAWAITVRDVRLHQPHAAARGAGDVAAGAVRASRCRATSRSSTRSTAGSSTRCARSSPATRTRLRRMSLIGEDGGKSVRMAHLATVGSHAINGVAALHSRAAEGERAQGLLRAVAGAVHQQDQRRHAAALPGAGQPRPARAARPTRSATAG